jgi:hypothetical protein
LIAQLDPGFTSHGFLANTLLVFIGSFFGAAGAFVAAWYIYRRTSKEERERFELELRESREQFQATIAHDIRMRREEEQQRAKERTDAESMQRLRLWYALRGEIDVNLRAINHIRANEADWIPLRRNILDESLGALSKLPAPTREAVQLASLYIDQSNSVSAGSPQYLDSLLVTQGMLLEAWKRLSGYIDKDLSRIQDGEDSA